MLTLQEIIKKFDKLKVVEQRELTQEYAEFVIDSKDIDKWNAFFTGILGPAVKPAGVETNKEYLDLTQEYGGVYDNQTLFKKDFENEEVIAMFWPWSDPGRTTLKIGIIKK